MLSPTPSLGGSPWIIAHRGVSGVYLENSLAAITAAVAHPEHQAYGIELDIHMTADGDFLVHHDPILADGTVIAATSLADLRHHRLPDGTPPPSLRDALQAAGSCQVYVEVKSLLPGGETAFLAQLREHRSGPAAAVHAFDHRIIQRLHRLDPVRLYGVLSASYPVDPIAPVQAAGARHLWQEASLIDAPLVLACATAGIAVIAWTVNDSAEADRLRALGVRGLCGNWPARLRVMSPR